MWFDSCCSNYDPKKQSKAVRQGSGIPNNICFKLTIYHGPFHFMSVHAMATGSCGCCTLFCVVCMLRLITRSGGLILGMISWSARLSSSDLATVMAAGVMRSSVAHLGRHCLSNATCPMRPRLFHACFVVSGIPIVWYMLRHL